MNLNKISSIKKVAKESGYTGLNSKDGMICDSSKINNSIIEASIQMNRVETRFFINISNGPLSVFQSKWKTSSFTNNIDLYEKSR